MIRTVDLFCGCGGIAVGFELHNGQLQYETVLGADIDAAALRVFNENLSDTRRKFPTGRRVDLSWFSHRSEVLLFYLTHMARWKPDQGLLTSLDALGYFRFLSQLHYIDRSFGAAAQALGRSTSYRLEADQIPASAVNLALFKGVLSKFGLTSITRPDTAVNDLPWVEEYSGANIQIEDPGPGAHHDLVAAVEGLWLSEVERVRTAAAGKGRGQHRPVAARMAPLERFFRSDAAAQLRTLWVDWRARRDTLRASFCLGIETQLDSIYRRDYQVDLLLGGPPCKGWSRIGRAVIEDLRAQGLHAWTSKEYGDERNALLHKYVLFLDALRPTAFLFENVAHFQSALRTPSGSVHATELLEEAINELSSDHIRYEVVSQIVRAKRHGIPQDRERFIMVGFYSRGTRSFSPTKFFEGLPRVSEEVPLSTVLLGLDEPGVFDPANRVITTNHRSRAFTLIDERMPRAQRDYLKWIRQPVPGASESPATTDGHIVRKPRTDDEALYRYLAPGMRWMDYKLRDAQSLNLLRSTVAEVQALLSNTHCDSQLLSRLADASAVLDDSLLLRLLLEATSPESGEQHHLLTGGYLTKGSDNHGDWLERLSPDVPCKTIVAHIGKDTYGYIHPYQPRALSLREAARVQTFPDFFKFGSAGVVDAYSMVGNAVPPMLASLFAQRFEDIHAAHDVFAHGNDISNHQVDATYDLVA